MRKRNLSPMLVIGDVLALLLFASLGRGSHHESTGFLAIGPVVGTAAPFIVGWYLVAIPLHALSADLLHRPRAMLLRTGGAWLVAWPVTLLLRAIILRRGIPVSFAIVVLLTNGLLLLGWRLTASAIVYGRARSS